MVFVEEVEGEEVLREQVMVVVWEVLMEEMAVNMVEMVVD